MENILCVLRQINACLGLYESEKLAKSGMTFAQVFLLNEILAMEPPKIFSHELCKRVGLAKSSVSRTLKELKKNGYIKCVWIRLITAKSTLSLPRRLWRCKRT